MRLMELRINTKGGKRSIKLDPLKMKNTVVRLLVGAGTTELLTSLILAMAMTVEAVRPDRSFPRPMKPAKIQGFHRNYKRCR